MSQQQSYRYAILMETNGEEFESWYNFIRYEGNEEALEHLQKQLGKVEFYILENMSTFDLEMEHLVSEETARQMCMVDLNSYMFHRKFDGKLQKIDFGFSRRDDNEDRIEKVHEKIGLGDIDNYVDGEEEFKDDNDNNSQGSDYSDSNDSDESESSSHRRRSQSLSPSSPAHSPSPVKTSSKKKDKSEKGDKKKKH